MPFVRDPCVFIFASKPYGTLYIGVTSDLIARLWQHRNGALPGFTSKYSVHMLVRFEQFGDMERAILREKQLKRWHRQWKINLIESENPLVDTASVRAGIAGELTWTGVSTINDAQSQTGLSQGHRGCSR